MTGTHLERLVQAARATMEERMKSLPLLDMKAQAYRRHEPSRQFARSLLAARAHGAALVAEVKRASPSKGAIAPGLDPSLLARSYERGGAACLSVLTEPTYFLGSLEDLEKARGATALPALRKDFLVAPYQLYEARLSGADAALLIVAALEKAELLELRELARELKLDVLVEVHEESELEAAAAAQPELLGINARSLKTLAVDAGTFARLAPKAISIAPLVAESGVRSADDVRALAAAGASAFLVGEALSSAQDPEGKVRELVQALPGNKP